MAPAFAHTSLVRRTRSTLMSTPANRLAARARLASAATATNNSDAPRHARKRLKTETVPLVLQSPAPAPPSVAERVLSAERKMSQRLAELTFDPPVSHVYDPLTYAWDAHEWYVNKFGNSRKDILMVGMNPGPWGMAQTGVPFGEVGAVRDWMKMPADIRILKPSKENAKRPVMGLGCTRSEVSGKRLWHEWAEKTYGSAADFFSRFFVHNYCPLLFLMESGRNRTPAQLRAMEREQLVETCDEALREVVRAIRPRLVCGVGGFATERCRAALKDLVDKGLLIGTVLHPSPASPAANRGWAKQATARMQELTALVSASEDVWEK